MVGVFKKFIDSNEKQMRKTEPILKKIKDYGKELNNTSFEKMKERILEMKAEIKPLVDAIPDENKKSLQKVENRRNLSLEEKKVQDKLMEFLPEVFAMLNEAYIRKFGYPFHDVQLQAGITLAQGQRLVEMYTGEGKTQTFQLPLVLYALTGRGAHLVTVNDYLTKVGAEFAGHMISELGLSVGIITPNSSYKFISDDQIQTYKGEEGVKLRAEQEINIDKMQGVNLVECEKREAYNCDITYGTNNEFGFDYLRDNMSWEVSRLVQRELYFCIVDEADSILIDEARTPLIISATPSDADTEKYVRFANAVKDLEETKDYEVDHKSRSATFTEEGMRKVELFLGVENAWADFSMVYHLENALKAKALFHLDDEYIVRNGEVLIVDEFTGRILKNRRYSEGLHQAIEAKEGVDIQQESRTYATITFQNFFRLYKILCGGSGTIMTEGEEFYKIYELESVIIPTNKPSVRKDAPDRIFKTSAAKWKAVASEIKALNEIGRPVLVGTTSVENSETLSKLLDEMSIKHEVLNAKFHEQEARIVAQAGKRASVTVATNMAGRGTDIIIGGGKRGDSEWKTVAELGGLHVIGTERHDARRIDNQLRGRTARQGEPGTTRFYVSLEDKIMRVLGGDIIAKLMNLVRVPDDMPIEMGMISKQIDMAQRKVEGLNFESRKNVVDYDDVMNQHREVFYTRRRNVLVTSETALGKILDNGKFINLNLPENKDKNGAYKEKMELSKERVSSILRDIVDDEIDLFISTHVAKNKINETEAKELLEKLFNLIPQTVFSAALDQKPEQVEVYLKQLITDINRPALEEAMNNVFDYKKKEFGEDFYNLCKVLMLEEMDKRWVDHLEIMKGIREAVGLQGYAQRDPLVEYKNRAFEVFESFVRNTDSEIAKKLFKVAKVQRPAPQQRQTVKTNVDQIEDVLTGDREMTPEDAAFRDAPKLEKADEMVDKIQRKQRMTQALLKTNSSENSSSTVKSTQKEYGRNDRVTVKYTDGTVVKDVKYKKIEADVKAGNCVIVD